MLSFDWENVSVAALRKRTAGLKTRAAPPLRALATGQDRLAEKRLFERLGIPTTRYAAVASRRALASGAAYGRIAGGDQDAPHGLRRQGAASGAHQAEAHAAFEALGPRRCSMRS